MKFLQRLFGGQSALDPPPPYRAFTTKFDREVTVSQLEAGLHQKDRLAWETRWSVNGEKILRWINETHIAADGKADLISATFPNLRDELVVSILIDHSGSMRWDNAYLACAIMGFTSAFLCDLGISHEVLGFTTSSWKGGSSRLAWQMNRTANPGRLCDLLHIIYRDADETAPLPMSAAKTILQSDLLKENIDGEALQRARKRLTHRSELRKLIIVISDGAPVDDSTLSSNSNDYLYNHVLSVIDDLSQTSGFELAGIGLQHDVSAFYESSISLVDSSEMAQKLPGFLSELLMYRAEV